MMTRKATLKSRMNMRRRRKKKEQEQKTRMKTGKAETKQKTQRRTRATRTTRTMMVLPSWPRRLFVLQAADRSRIPGGCGALGGERPLRYLLISKKRRKKRTQDIHWQPQSTTERRERREKKERL